MAKTGPKSKHKADKIDPLVMEFVPFSAEYADRIDLEKCLKRLVRSLSENERLYFKGTKYYSYPIRFKNKIRAVVESYVRKYNDTDMDCWSFSGFSSQEFIRDIESKFEPWMSWDNWGLWHIDHIVPRSSYTRTGDRSIFGLLNMIPISREDNLRKGSKHV